MQSGTRLTQHDLARQLGISQVTVSRALAGSALVSAETLKRVQEAAAASGYRPDPALASLNAYRLTRKPISRGQTLAWLTPVKSSIAKVWFQGAHKRATTLGYGLELFSQETKGMTMPRLLSILANRGVQGLVIAPQRSSETRFPEIDLSPFAAITIGYSVQEPVIDRVITDHHHNVILAFQQLRAAGYKRIGMLSSGVTEVRIEGRRIGAYRYMQERHSDLDEIPLLRVQDIGETASDETLESFANWMRQWQPDALLFHQPWVPEACRDLGLSIPQEIGLACVALNSLWKNYKQWSGVDEQLEATGALAIDTLVSRLRNNERGIPADRRIYLLEGKWHSGQTTRPQTPSSHGI